MKRFLASLCLAAAVLCASAATAHAQSGILLRTFNAKAGRLLLDPVRPRLYATLPLNNSIAVIDTDTNTLLTTVFIGANPVDLAISSDGALLYVANGGSDQAAIGVLDLDRLTARLSLPAPGNPTAIAAGLDNRVYVLCQVNGANPIVQMDGITGEIQATFGSANGFLATLPSGFLQISPDRKTLFYASAGGSPSTLMSFDVSTATPALIQQAPFGSTGSNGEDLTVSHNGNFLVFPNGGGNSQSHRTSLIPANNLGGVLGTFGNGFGGYPGPAAFSADDTLLYEAWATGGTKGQYAFRIFSTTTFEQLDVFDDPAVTTYDGPLKTITSLVATSPNGYLYVAAKNGSFGDPVDLQMISTQRAPFFDGSATLSGGYYYLKFPDGVPFAYYNFVYSPYLYHDDLGFAFPFDAADGQGGIYLYDFTSQTFWYTSASLYPYLYDFSIQSWLYYYPDPTRTDHYNTKGVRYFYDFADRGIISK